MNEDLLIKLADLGSPEKIANCITDHFPDIVMPISLERIAEAVGIVEIVGRTSDCFEGALVTTESKSKGSIIYNDASKIERRRFTISHELGHFLIPFHNANTQCAKIEMGVFQTNKPGRAKEVEANLFASSLLMPRKFFARDIQRLKSPEIEHILKLATDYQVSKAAAARRYIELCDHMCAIVFSRYGKLQYLCKTTDFPFINIRKDQALPARSSSARREVEIGQVSDWVEMESEIWVNSSSRELTLYEQFFDQGNGYRISMLMIDDLACSDEDGDESENRSFTWGN
jgi:Zn-dependent peptidase ImmA (M78 family)